jgi:hypothetical protein
MAARPNGTRSNLADRLLPAACGVRNPVVPGFMIGLGDGAGSFGLIIWLGRGDGAWLELAGWFEQRAAQVLQEPQAV